jgi:NhaA family Na+:H+ antiporter
MQRPEPTTITNALRRFVAEEVAGGVVLVLAAVAALVWANSPWGDTYRTFWHHELSISLGSSRFALDLRDWVNDGLMALFFCVVGLEVKRELLEGELRNRRHAALPVVAAIGGMVVPATIYFAWNAGGPASHGWGIPMATDIAFALGVAALLSRFVPPPLRLFLLTLAIVDDIGSILVIAIFYSKGIEWGWLLGAIALVVAAYLLRGVGVRSGGAFVAVGIALWFLVYESGLHATLAGVAMGLLAPAQPDLDREAIADRAEAMLDTGSAEAAWETTRLARLAVSQMEWLEHGLHPWTSLVVVPLFALANAGVEISASSMRDALGSRVAWGIVAGLVAGKTIGISLFAWLGCRLGVADLPSDTRWSQVVGVAGLAGIGFTVSLFVTNLAFDQPALLGEAKIAILFAAVLASAVGTTVLLTAARSVRSGRAGTRDAAPPGS